VSLSFARCPLGWLALAALASCGLAQWWQPAGIAVAALVAAATLSRSPPLGIAALTFALRLALPDPPWPALPPLRDAIAAPVLRAMPEPDGSIAVGSLFGGRGALPRDVFEAFTRTGTSHLLAVSGFNITLAASGLGLALRPFGARAASAATFLAAFGLATVAGFGPSVSRAAIMASVGTAAAMLGRPLAGLNALGAAVCLLLLASPGAISDAGFLMSVAATAGLVLGAGPLEQRLRGPRWLRAQLAATLAASCASLPVVAQIFGRVPLIAPLVNIAVAPLVPPLMGTVGIAAALGQLAPGLAAPAAWLAYIFARAVRATVEFAAQVPIATVTLPHAGLLLTLISALVAMVVWRSLAKLVIARVWTASRLSGLTRARTLAIAGLVAALVFAAVASLQSASARIVALDVGQGDAFLVEAEGARVVIDGGPHPDRVLRALGDALPFTERRIDLVALTHAHADHATGLMAVIDRYDVGLAVEPEGMEAGPIADAWHAAAARRGIPVRALRRGDGIRLRGVAIEVLAPAGGSVDDLANLVLRVRAGPIVALLLGDATNPAQADLLLRSKELRAMVYAPPHHGAATPHADALVAAVRPQVVLLSVGARNRYGHPASDTLRALEGVPLMRTDRDGTLEVAAYGRSIHCRTRASALSGAWSRWLSGSPPCARTGAPDLAR
jgi:competence protein ComEC